MALQASTAGDRLNLTSGTIVPKRPVSTYTTPAAGDMVKVDTTGNDLVNICSATDVPYGLVWDTNSGNGVLSILRFKDNAIVLQYTGTFAVGDKIVADGSAGTVAVGGVLRQRVRRDNTNGIGTVTDKDVPVTNLCVVEF